MMSSQTTDLVNERAMRRLHEACGITIEGLEALGEEGIIAAIQPVSFYTAKAQNILKVCKILRERYDGDVPRTFEELLELPGIGPKMVRRFFLADQGCLGAGMRRFASRNSASHLQRIQPNTTGYANHGLWLGRGRGHLRRHARPPVRLFMCGWMHHSTRPLAHFPTAAASDPTYI